MPTTQAPLPHVAMAWGSCEQLWPHTPQFSGSCSTPTSQPLAGLLSQSRKPCRQPPLRHLPPMQSGLALGTLQVIPQPPQLDTSPSTLASQPSPGLPLQSAKPGLQPPTPQTPLAHTGVAFMALQATPQRPQLV